MSRIRTIPKAMAEIKAKDPDTYLTAHAIQRWVKQGKIPAVPTGEKHTLIDMDKLEAFLTNENQ